MRASGSRNPQPHFFSPLLPRGQAGLVDEIKVLMRCRSKYIVAFMGVVVDEGAGEVQILTERMPGGNLWRALRRGEVTWERNGWRIARDVACGLVIFSSRRIVHNDLKSSNILLAGDGTAKISDVGLAHIISDSQSYLATQAGKRWGGRGRWGLGLLHAASAQTCCRGRGPRLPRTRPPPPHTRTHMRVRGFNPLPPPAG